MFSFFNATKNSRVYLDNAGATEVSSRSKRALEVSIATYGNPSGIHQEGAHAGQLLDKARTLCASVLNVHAYEIFFMSSGTESCNLAIIGTYLGATEKNEISEENFNRILPHMIVSCFEHPAILEPVKYLEREGKITVTYLPVYNDGIIKVKDLRDALTENTILVSVMYANNEVGTIQPIKEIGRAIEEWKMKHERTHTAYPYFHTDACQAANYCNLDAVRLRVHLMTVNSSKVYGPKGIALLYKREGVRVHTVTYGGGQERELRSGTENVAGAFAFGIALQESEEKKEKEIVRLTTLRNETVRALVHEIPDIVFYGAFESTRQEDLKNLGVEKNKTKEMVRLPNNINCRVPRIHSEEMILRLDSKGFAVSHKSACASMETEGSYVVMALGATEEEAHENIRISMGRNTKADDMKRLVAAMKDIEEKYRG